MRYTTYIFDFDYTLGDATPGVIESTNFALGRMGFPAALREAIRRTVGMPLPDAFTFLTGNAKPKLKSLFVDLFLKRAEEVMTGSTELFADTIKVLNLLKANGAGLGIVSTKHRRRLLQILDKFGIDHLFDVIVGGDDVKSCKPDPEGLFQAMASLGVTRQNVLYTGDSIIDTKTAKNAGVDFVAVTTGTTGKEAFLPYPHIAVIDSLSDLLEVIKTEGGSCKNRVPDL